MPYKDPEKQKAYVKDWIKKDRKGWNKYMRNYIKNHPEKFRLGRFRWNGKTREKLFHILGHVCVRCGFFDKRALQFDHIFGGGTKELKKFHNQVGRRKYYTEHPIEAKRKLQVLCANCNSIKKTENSETKKS